MIVGTALIARCLQLENGTSIQTTTLHIIAAGAGFFLLLGLWTPVAGVILAITELLIAFSPGQDSWASVLLGSLGIAIALLGSGAWSVDARRSGWKRIEIRRPEN
jgi:uncharacterized membrane protein YphA (DoxX/SURF4 family)